MVSYWVARENQSENLQPRFTLKEMILGAMPAHTVRDKISRFVGCEHRCKTTMYKVQQKFVTVINKCKENVLYW